MTTTRDETGNLLDAAVQDFLTREHHAERLHRLYEGRPALDRDFWRQLAEQGWLALRLPESLDGSGLATAHAAIVAERWGRHLVPEPFVAGAVMPCVLAAALPGAAGWRPVVGGLLDGEHVATVAWQEQPQTLDATVETTTATAAPNGSPNGYRLNGTKFGVVAAGFANSLLVSARLDGRAALWRVPRDAAGVTIDESRTSDGGTVAVLRLSDVPLPADALLASGDAVPAALRSAIDEATLLGAFQLVGVAGAALDQTLEYLRIRVQFGHRIGSFQALQHFAVDVRLQQALARAACRAALQRHAGDRAAPATRALIAAAKARASDAALLAGRFGVQAHGAIGFAAEAGIGQYLKSALRLAAWLGNGSQQRQRFGMLASLHAEASQ